MAQKKRGHPRTVKRYKHLTVFERALIGQKHKEGMHEQEIAKLIKRDRSTVIREIERNSSGINLGYRPEFAHTKALYRRAKRGIRPRLKSAFIRAYAATKLKEGWSPEQISIRLHIEHKGQTISPEAIYQYIYTSFVNVGTGKVRVGHEDLRVYLARRHKRREKKGFRAT